MTPTEEQIEGLIQSADTLRTIASRAREVEAIASIITGAETTFGDFYPVLRHQPLGRQVTHILSRLQRFRELTLEHDKLKIDLAQARRENEALVRNVPPVPPLMEEVTHVDPICVIEVLGQAWCKTTQKHPSCPELVSPTSSHRMVLCNVHQNVTTGEVTYVPISFDELPKVTEAAAS